MKHPTTSKHLANRDLQGSGVVAIAALHCGIKYEGVCINANHKQWLEGMLDKAIYAVAVESPESAKAVGVTQECVANIKLFFQGTVKEANRYLLASGGGDSMVRNLMMRTQMMRRAAARAIDE